ncbi:MAG TPA: amidohydrolase [Saprospiraceae bacterium]|nr:amidohydrolase [Saprospiraceae bacterium]HNT20932.1 amidohydrolase [Saprospiraceae bacterium]
MKWTFTSLLFVLSASAFGQLSKTELYKNIDRRDAEYSGIAQNIWDYAEVGFQEFKSSNLLKSLLKKEGFSIQDSVAGMPTAFIASFGTGKPVIALLGEYDALPGLSQDRVPYLKILDGKPAGHACGHHLFGTASAAAAIEVKNWLKASGTVGTIRFYGSPAEEGGSGKVYLVRENQFRDVDVVLHWHPADANNASASPSLANKTAKFRFYGVASHAAMSPERGRSALDGVEAMNAMVNLMREHIPSDARIHYVITRGGEAPNVVPAFAEVYYYVRHPRVETVSSIWERIEKAALGAAMGTETKAEWEIISGVYNLLPNAAISGLMDKNLRISGGYSYIPEEKDFAVKIQSTFRGTLKDLSGTSAIAPFAVSDVPWPASTDVGDVSWVVPTAGLSTATWVPGTTAHSWQAVAAGGTSIGIKGMLVAAKTLAGTAVDLFNESGLIEEAWKELKMRRGEPFEYKPMIGDRKPALDYRN